MSVVRRILLLITLAAIALQFAAAQVSQQVTITEPRVYQLSELYKEADLIAVVRIVSGDTQNYPTSVCEAEVIQNFKGTASGSTIYFGPCVGKRLGWGYVVFLRNRSQLLKPKTTLNAAYGTIRCAEVFDEGYSAMETSHVCVFDGREIAQQCDEGVRVCTDYIVLPATIRTFPEETEKISFGCRWVRKTAFLSLVEALGRSK